MASICFDQLLTIYRHTTFDLRGDEGVLSIVSPDVLAAINTIEGDEQAGEDANLAVLVEPNTLAVGQKVRIRVGAPRLALGVLVRTFNDLLSSPEARLSEPKAYFVVDRALEKSTRHPPSMLIAYRKILELVALFAEAASYLDRTRQELVFFREGKFVVPVRYDAEAISKVSLATAEKLLDMFREDLHKDQKLAILSEAIAHTGESQPVARRFAYLLENIDKLVDEVGNGYRLFVSSFSYSKIRSELENAKVEYIGKIHRTLIDIQGQLLGIPVATIVVASQLKVATSCGLEFWTNIAVLSGAWIFVILLLVAIINQWLTLTSIGDEIARQKGKLANDYAAISDQFTDVLSGLSGRISWHRYVLIGLGIIAFMGAIFATAAFHRLDGVDMRVCFASSAPKASVTQGAGSTATEAQPPAALPSGAVSAQPRFNPGGPGLTVPKTTSRRPPTGGINPVATLSGAKP